jgi:cytochrome c5
VSTETPVPAEETEPPQPTATPEATEVVPTEEPTPEPTEPEPSPTEPEPSPTVSPEPDEPTATAEPTTEPPGAEGEVLLEERCTACHTLDRVERAQKTQEEWVTTVERMIGLGAQLSESEKTTLVDYLAETYGP